MDQTDWLTLCLVCLVNEVHYVYQILNAKKMGKVIEKLREDPKNHLKKEYCELKMGLI